MERLGGIERETETMVSRKKLRPELFRRKRRAARSLFWGFGSRFVGADETEVTAVARYGNAGRRNAA